MRTLIYARYSSTLQNPRSIEDQLAACRERAAREGWQVLGEYHDQAISGAAGIDEAQRPGLAAMLARVEAGGIDQVLTESTDRIARHQGDAFTVRERMQYAGARLFTLMDGEVDDITGTIKGLFDARMRKDLAQRVKRGQKSNLGEGRSAGGLAYGYRRVARFDEKGEAIRGLREIDEETADIVRRAFREYAAGESPRAIAGRFNQEGVPPPKRGVWRASTFIGNRTIGFGILANPIYVGRLVYGRSKIVVDPRTREKRCKRGDGPLIEGAAPHLRIIDDALWHAVQEQIASRALGRPEKQRRPRHVLSGLCKCGECGGNYVVIQAGWWGCSSAYSKACDNHRMIRTAELERRVMDDLKAQMLAPDVVTAYLQEYHREHAARTAKLSAERARMTAKLEEAKRKVARLVAAIADGAGEFAEVREQMASAKADQVQLERELASAEALPVIALHPGLATRYREEIEGLEVALADEHARIEAVPRLRKLISRVELRPTDAKRGLDVDVVRHIDEVLALSLPAVRRAGR